MIRREGEEEAKGREWGENGENGEMGGRGEVGVRMGGGRRGEQVKR
jgi:hypothetical protein